MLKPAKLALDKKPTWRRTGWNEAVLPVEGPGEPDIPMKMPVLPVHRLGGGKAKGNGRWNGVAQVPMRRLRA